MVETQIAARGIDDPRILSAFLRVPRHLFVPASERVYAYSDQPLPIGHGQTISQPYIVAEMCALARLEGGERVLEVGTGSGYAAAILSHLAAEIYSVERIGVLAEHAAKLLRDQGYENVQVLHGDGYRGLPEHAAFDAVILSAAPPEVPSPLLEQLSPGGRLIAPVGRENQYLQVYRKTEKGFQRRIYGAVRFVEMKHGFS
mgnify:CR=1 FL=1